MGGQVSEARSKSRKMERSEKGEMKTINTQVDEH